ncbi:MAG TPA: lamin tail domain-containing protein [Flavisolibacter sp.]|nr:lamin tail domain-containing protein [Flavisolibacter sp.]
MNAAKTLLTAFAVTAGFLASAQLPDRFAVVITEIMADPAPAVGLPNAEYIELRNTTATALPLNGWKLSDKTTTTVLNTSFILQPDSVVILCTNSNAAALSAYGRTVGVSSFPSLDNNGDVITLHSPQNRLIHAVGYEPDWYGDDTKKAGGWSLEMINPQNPCTGKENWKASINALGGTPGKTNSVNGNNADATPPQLKRAYATDSVTIVLIFDEPLDSSSAAVVSNYHLPSYTVTAAKPVAPLFQAVQLQVTAPLQAGTTATLTATNLTDCKGNLLGAYNHARIGLSQPAMTGDVVINEILFRPRPGGSDYVELYNRSNKVIDAATLLIANRNSSGVVSSLKKIAEEPSLLFPGDYMVLTENKTELAMQYLVKNDDAVWQLPSLPTFPNDKGTVVLQSNIGNHMDEVAYTKDWHFGLVADDAGVALERIDPDDVSQKAANWHSAAATAGYGTPGYQNSQYRQTESVKATVAVSPAIFSPDNDGRDDIATIAYQVEESGYVANVFLFDAAGRTVRHLVKNDLLGLKGSWSWDGLDERRNKLPIGTYIVFTEIFTLGGRKKSFKNTVVLARQLN